MSIRFLVSNGPGSAVGQGSIVRVVSADPNPAGPGIRTVAADAASLNGARRMQPREDGST
jgi:hypothetical protein